MPIASPRLRGVFGIVCIALVLMSGMVQAAHFHASAQAEHDCALCVAAHHVAQAAAPISMDLISVQVNALAPVRRLHRPRRAVYFRLSSRPPPSSSALVA
ncbi:MAG: hypothetical protein WA891_02345 [Acidobacteriaceae bacterium]